MSDIIPSKQIAEQAIAGIAEMVRELNELRQFKASVPWPAIDQCGMIAMDTESGHEDGQITMGFVWANRPKEPHP